MVELKTDWKKDLKADIIKEFKEMFDNYVIDYLNNKETLNNTMELIYESEENFNNADTTSGQYIYNKENIGRILKEIKKNDK